MFKQLETIKKNKIEKMYKLKIVEKYSATYSLNFE
jgi:hypothetical protein